MNAKITKSRSPPPVDSTLFTGKQAVAALVATTLGQLCIKLLWQSIFTAITNLGPLGDYDCLAFAAGGFLLSMLACIDGSTHIFYLAFTQDGGEFNQGSSGVVLASVYVLCRLPFVSSLFGIFRMCVWVNFFFNVGCLVEVIWRPFERRR